MTSANGLAANSTHSFRVDYVTTDGRKSPISPSASGTTWQGYNWGGIPFEWMTQYYGSDISKWPARECSAGCRRADGAASVPERRQSDDSSHVAANNAEQHAGRIVPRVGTLSRDSPIRCNQRRHLAGFGPIWVRRVLRRAPVIQFLSARVPRAITASCSCANERCMRQLIKCVFVDCLSGVGRPIGLGFFTVGSLGSPVLTRGAEEDNWQVRTIGYDPLPNGSAPPFIGTTPTLRSQEPRGGIPV